MAFVIRFIVALIVKHPVNAGLLAWDLVKRLKRRKTNGNPV
jgi:ABC-type thiamin/hydroxymethylpyrimidine transport system permease subunit